MFIRGRLVSILLEHIQDKMGKTFNEKSISINVVGVEKNTLFKIAEDLKTVFKQEAILVKWNNQVYFVS